MKVRMLKIRLRRRPSKEVQKLREVIEGLKHQGSLLANAVREKQAKVDELRRKIRRLERRQ